MVVIIDVDGIDGVGIFVIVRMTVGVNLDLVVVDLFRSSKIEEWEEVV